MEYVNGYGLDTTVYENLVNHFYGFEEYYYYKKDEYYKDYIFIIRELDNIKNNKPMLDAYKHAIIGWYISFKNLKRMLNMKNRIFRITDACQLYCKHCYNQNLERSHKFMTYDEFLFLFYKHQNLAEKFIHKQTFLDEMSCDFEGGEATLNQDLSKMIAFLNKKNIRSQVLTNAIDIPDNVLSVLSEFKLNSLQISLDGFEDTHDYIRGIGSFNKTIKNIKKAQSYNIPIKCLFTAHKHNYKEYSKLKKYLLDNFNIKLSCEYYINQNNAILKPLEKDELLMCKNIFKYSGGNLSIINYNGDYVFDGHYYTGDSITNYFTDSLDDMFYKIKKHIIRMRSVPIYCFDCKKVDACLGGMISSSFKICGLYNKEDVSCHILGKKERGEMYEIGTI